MIITMHQLHSALQKAYLKSGILETSVQALQRNVPLGTASPLVFDRNIHSWR